MATLSAHADLGTGFPGGYGWILKEWKSDLLGPSELHRAENTPCPHGRTLRSYPAVNHWESVRPPIGEKQGFSYSPSRAIQRIQFIPVAKSHRTSSWGLFLIVGVLLCLAILGAVF